MSNKAHNKLTPTDQIIRDTLSATREPFSSMSGEETGSLFSIDFVRGFEKFNTRPYHNYETFGDGYRVTGRGVTLEREDLDDAIADWSIAVWEAFTA